MTTDKSRGDYSPSSLQALREVGTAHRLKRSRRAWSAPATCMSHLWPRPVSTVAISRPDPPAADFSSGGPATDRRTGASPAQPTSCMASWHACSHRRQASAQMRQCSWRPAWRSHSSPHTRHAAAQTWSIWRKICSLEPVRREPVAPVAAQTSAQSRLSRMHWRRSWTMSSARQASAHAVQACAQA